VEIADSTAEELTANDTSPAAALLELNRLFTGWVETVYHQRVHTETEQQPLARWTTGWERTGRRPQIPGVDDLAEAFRWAEFRNADVAVVPMSGRDVLGGWVNGSARSA
jgi:putative transposase